MCRKNQQMAAGMSKEPRQSSNIKRYHKRGRSKDRWAVRNLETLSALYWVFKASGPTPVRFALSKLLLAHPELRLTWFSCDSNFSNRVTWAGELGYTRDPCQPQPFCNSVQIKSLMKFTQSFHIKGLHSPFFLITFDLLIKFQATISPLYWPSHLSTEITNYRLWKNE